MQVYRVWMNLAPICVYTIIHPARLDEHRRKRKPLTEKTRWTRIRAALDDAHHENADVIVLFADARRIDGLFAWGPLEHLRVDETTEFSLRGVYAFDERHRHTELTSAASGNRISDAYIRPYLPCQTPAFMTRIATAPVPWAYDREAFLEGREVLRAHRARERSRELREAKIRAAPALRCEVCDFDFGATYPVVGDGFIEVHHVSSLSERGPGGGTTTLDDLALVCANCHRMLHRSEIDIDELRGIVREARAAPN